MDNEIFINYFLPTLVLFVIISQCVFVYVLYNIIKKYIKRNKKYWRK